MRAFAGFSNKLAGAVFAAALAATPASALSDEGRFRLLQSETLRVETIFLRLTRAAAPFCAQRGPQLGLILHQRAQYRPEVRDAAKRVFGLDEAPSVLAVAPGSAAARAGLLAGDAIVAVNGVPLPTFPIDAVQGNAGRLAGEALGRAVARGAATLSVRRGGTLLSLDLAAEDGCAGAITLEPSQALNAQSAKGRVLVTTALVEFAESDDELAFLIGHELAHLAVGEKRGRDAEAQADLTGLRFAKAAGYDSCAAPSILDRLASARHQGLRIDLDHPSTRRRIAALIVADGGTCPVM